MPGLPGIRIDRCLKLGPLPGRSIVDGDIDLSHLPFAAPGMPTHLKGLGFQSLKQVGWPCDQGFDRHDTDDFKIFFRNLFSRSNGMTRHAIGSPCHLGAIMHTIAHLKTFQPFPTGRSGPARTDQPERKTMLGWQGNSIHFPGQKRVWVQGFLNRNPS